MISTLHIKNVGIIDDVTIDLNEGLNILTGETGARQDSYNRFFANYIWRKIF